ncbi:MAG TPA: Ppx/GppA phosphatase family protein [Nitrospirota bacterium]
MILAGIDIGTNTLRLLVAETGPDVFHEVYADRRITRLGQDLDRTGRLSSDAQERSLAALLEFSGQMRSRAVSHAAAIGTSALRNASNSRAFIDEVEKRTGLAVRIVSGEEEARLTLLGVTQALRGCKGPGDGGARFALVIDIGGGSTEVISSSSPKRGVASLPLGAVYLTERFIRHDPPSTTELEQMRHAIDVELGKLGAAAGRSQGILAGTAGTITTLAAIDQGLTAYEPGKINGYSLKREAVDRMIHTLVKTTLEERRLIPGLDPGREDIILAGAVVAQEIMKRFGYDSMFVSDGGLREGIVLDLYEKVAHGRSRPRKSTEATKAGRR